MQGIMTLSLPPSLRGQSDQELYCALKKKAAKRVKDIARRAAATPEDLVRFREYWRLNAAKRRAALTPEQKESRRVRAAAKREAFTPEEREQYRMKEQERAAAKQRKITPHQRERRRARMTLNR